MTATAQRPLTVVTASWHAAWSDDTAERVERAVVTEAAGLSHRGRLAADDLETWADGGLRRRPGTKNGRVHEDAEQPGNVQAGQARLGTAGTLLGRRPPVELITNGRTGGPGRTAAGPRPVKA